jgi:hypothetical protein
LQIILSLGLTCTTLVVCHFHEQSCKEHPGILNEWSAAEAIQKRGSGEYLPPLL